MVLGPAILRIAGFAAAGLFATVAIAWMSSWSSIASM